MYGFALTGFDRPDAWLLPAAAAWPDLRVVRSVLARGAPRPASPMPARFDDRIAEVGLADGGSLVADRHAGTVTIVTTERLDDAALAHPFLAFPLAVAAHWRGRQVFHGGVFLHGDGAWALLGAKEAGKSSTLASLLAGGVTVLADDLAVVEGRTVYTGPRSIDLRGDAAEVLGGVDLGLVGGRRRWRLDAGVAPPSAPLAGFVVLEWGDAVEVRPVPAGERLSVLVEHGVVRSGDLDPLAYLDLAGRPMWRLVRPRRPEGLDRRERLEDVNRQLLDALG